MTNFLRGDQHHGIDARAVTLRVSQITRAIEWGRDFDFYRIVVDCDTNKILGATLVGYETAGLMHVFLDLIEAGITWQLLEQSVHIHPTYGEALPGLARLLLGFVLSLQGESHISKQSFWLNFTGTRQA